MFGNQQIRVVCAKCGRDITSRTNQADCTAIHLRSCTGKRGFIVNSPVNADRSQNPVTSASK